jgi:hypothetical protein
MIRNPSDGSVREPAKSTPVTSATHSAERAPNSDAASPGVDTGLPILGDQREIERLNRSRLWLKQRNEGSGE